MQHSSFGWINRSVLELLQNQHWEGLGRWGGGRDRHIIHLTIISSLLLLLPALLVLWHQNTKLRPTHPKICPWNSTYLIFHWIFCGFNLFGASRPVISMHFAFMSYMSLCLILCRLYGCHHIWNETCIGLKKRPKYGGDWKLFNQTVQFCCTHTAPEGSILVKIYQ